MVGGKIWKLGLYLFVLVVASFLIKAQPDIVSNTYQYSIPNYNEMPEMYREIVNEVTSNEIYYELNPNDIYINETGNYSEIILEDFFCTHNFGMPMLPIKYFEIPIPSDAKSFKINVVNPTYTKINVNKKIKPFVPEEHDFLDRFPRYEIYDEYSSSPNYVTVDFGYRGNQKYALVRYYPFGYDFRGNKLNVTTSAVLEIVYDAQESVGKRTLYDIREALTARTLSSNGQGPDVGWEKIFGGNNDDYAYSIQQTTDGGYIIAGETYSFGSGTSVGTSDIYLIKTDFNGNEEWNKTFGGIYWWDKSYSAQQTTDGGYIISACTGHYVYLIKTGSDGNMKWSKRFGGTHAYSVQQTTDGGYVIVGEASDVYLIKTDFNGNEEWSKIFGGSNVDFGYSVQQTNDEGYIIAGGTRPVGTIGLEDVYLIKTYSNGSLEWNKTFGEGYAHSVQQTNDGEYIIAGGTYPFGMGGSSDSDVYLIKTYPNGNMEWSKTFGGSTADYAYSVQQTTDGGYIIAGYTWSFGAGSSDFYLIKTNSDGNMEWSKTFGGSNRDYGRSVQQTTSGGYTIAGYTTSFGAGGYDVYLMNLASETAHCSNKIKDYDETDIDCGGSCPKCSDGKSCLVDSDCQSNYCNPNKICENFIDLSVDSSDISFTKVGNKINISAIIKNSGKSIANNVEIKFMDTYNNNNNNLIKETTINIDFISAGDSKTASITWDLAIGHVIYVIVDPEDKIKESDKSNNNAKKEYTGTLKYYVEADVPPSVANNEIENYIKENIKDGVIVNNKEEADIKVLVARHNPLIMWHFAELEKEDCGFIGGGAVRYQGKTCDKPYCAIVCDTVEKDGKKEIYVEANDIDGFIAASKKFVEEQDSFKSTENAGIFLDEKDEDAIAVYDYLHTDENLVYYKKDNDQFKEIVGKALRGEKYNIIDKNITVGDTKLRLKNLEPVKSGIFREYKDKDGLPVVMGGGLWSDITAWNGLGSELSDEGFDVFLIEITGGPDMECDDCEDYTYEFLTDEVYPAYVDEVKSLSGKSKIKYVGHSNGARVALDSLTKGKVNPNDVDTLVLVGVPGNFSELSYFAQLVNNSGSDAIQRMRSKELKHVTFSRVAHEMAPNDIWGILSYLRELFTGENSKISLNLLSRYNELISSDEDGQPGKGLIIDYFTLIYGTDSFDINLFGLDRKRDDFIVAVKDEISIFNKIFVNNSSNKVLRSLFKKHTAIADDKETGDLVKQSLDKSIYK